MNSLAQKYIVQQLAFTGFVMVASGLAVNLRPDLLRSGQKAIGSLGANRELLCKLNSTLFNIRYVNGEMFFGRNGKAEKTPKAITVDGVERQTHNTDGKPIHRTLEGVKNFWRWFNDVGASEGSNAGVLPNVRTSEVSGRNRAADDQAWRSRGVLDAQGRPTVLYHGTSDDVDTFEHDHSHKKDYGWLATAFTRQAILSYQNVIQTG